MSNSIEFVSVVSHNNNVQSDIHAMARSELMLRHAAPVQFHIYIGKLIDTFIERSPFPLKQNFVVAMLC
jgi:hypothetical protein